MANEKPEAQLSIRGIYTKSLSFESSASPFSFKEPIQPEMRLEIRVTTHELSDDQQEVILDINLTARNKDNLLYLMKIQQAGCFILNGFTEEQKVLSLNTFCANMLYPYASQHANMLAVQSGFAPINLLPIDFMQLYQQKQKTAAPEKSFQEKNSAKTEQIYTKNKWEDLTPVKAD